MLLQGGPHTQLISFELSLISSLRMSVVSLQKPFLKTLGVESLWLLLSKIYADGHDGPKGIRDESQPQNQISIVIKW